MPLYQSRALTRKLDAPSSLLLMKHGIECRDFTVDRQSKVNLLLAVIEHSR